MLELLLFAVPAGLVILGALIVIFAKNPVHNSMGLVLTLASLAIIYITLNATFVAMVQMLVYAGAVMTLFLFVVGFASGPAYLSAASLVNSIDFAH